MVKDRILIGSISLRYLASFHMLPIPHTTKADPRAATSSFCHDLYNSELGIERRVFPTLMLLIRTLKPVADWFQNLNGHSFLGR